ncbi:MAG: ATP-binding protein [Candidatus Poribacteria bacterium]|nr:ATP-binding protein [Candidatus Poribacteria bacterium]
METRKTTLRRIQYRWFGSLSGQLLLMFVAASAIPALAVVFLPRIGLYAQSRASLQKAVKSELRKTAIEVRENATQLVTEELEWAEQQADGAIGKHVREIAKQNLDTMLIIGAWGSGESPLGSGAGIIVNNIVRERSRVVGYTIADHRGLTLASNEKRRPATVLNEIWWKETVQNNRPYIGKTGFHNKHESVVARLAVPIRENSNRSSKPVGAMRLTLSFPELNNLSGAGAQKEEPRVIEILGRDLHGPDNHYAYLASSSEPEWDRLENEDNVWVELEPGRSGAVKSFMISKRISLGKFAHPDLGEEEYAVEGLTAAEFADMVFERLSNSPNPPLGVMVSIRKMGQTFSKAAEDATTLANRPDAPLYSIEPDSNNVERVWARDNFVGPIPFWSALVSEPTTVAFISEQMLWERILWTVGLAAVVFGIISFLFVRRIVRPIRQITDAAHTIRLGNYQQAIPITSQNEIGILGEEFNAMTQTLQDALARIRQEERKLNSVLNGIAEGIVHLDLERRIVLLNPAAEALLNLPSDAVGKTVDEALDPQLLERLFPSDRMRPLSHRVNAYEVEIERNKQKIALKVVRGPVYYTDGAPTGTVYVLDDITREKEIDQMKSEFVALVSHELRTPLTSIYGYTRLILDGKTGAMPEVMRDKLERVERQAIRLSGLISDLLDLSRIESGRIELKLEPLDLAEIGKMRMDEISPQAAEKRIHLSFEAEPGLPLATGDAERIGQAVTNLLGNAVKFTPDDGRVETRVGREGGYLWLSVKDTGPGIAPNDQEMIFDKFRQASNLQTRKQGGTGLGLAIARSIIQAHGGEIWVESALGKGSEFAFRIPIDEAGETIQFTDKLI